MRGRWGALALVLSCSSVGLASFGSAGATAAPAPPTAIVHASTADGVVAVAGDEPDPTGPRSLRRTDDRVLRQGFSPRTDGRQSVPRPPARAKVLVLPVRWGSRNPTHSVAEIEQVVLDDAGRWFRRTSAGRHTLTGKVTDWIRLRSGTCGPSRALTDAALRVARKRGIAVSSFNRFMVITANCGQTGYGELPGKRTWIGGGAVDLATVAHELGHNLGLDHAYGLLCGGGQRVTIQARCVAQEYGDMYDAMGISTGPFAVPTLVDLEWARRTKDLAGSGTVELAPAEDPGDGVQGLRVRVSDKLSYWVEYRTEKEAAEPFGEGGAAGVQVRMFRNGRSFLLDGTPRDPQPFLTYPDPDLQQPQLEPGTSFTTPERIRIRTLSVADGVARVEVTRNYQPSAPTVPTAVLAVAGDDGTQVSWGRPADDHGSQVQQYRLRNAAGDVVEVSGSRLTRRFTNGFLQAGDTVQVQAVNALGASPWSEPVEAASYGPTVRIVAPTPGQVVGATFDVQVEVGPNAVTGAPVESVEYTVDCDDCYPDHVDYSAPYETWTAEIYGDGEHTVWVRARDTAGGSTLVSVTVDGSGYEEPRLELVSPADGATVGHTFDVVLDVVGVPGGLEALRVEVGDAEVLVSGALQGRVTVPVDMRELRDWYGDPLGPGWYTLRATGWNDSDETFVYTFDDRTITYEP